MTTTTDPRDSLPTNAAGVDRSQPVASAEYLDFDSLEATQVACGLTWTTRGQNAVLQYLHPSSDGEFVAANFSSETTLVLANESSAATVHWNTTSDSYTDRTVVVIPPGQVTITNNGSGDLILLVRSDEPGWATSALNSPSYAEPHPRVAHADAWPEPVGEPALRSYRVADFPAEDGRFGWIFRTRSFMVNFVPPHEGPRDKTRLSPHYHDDFEQYSVATNGTYVHHIRTPWLTDSTQWTEDEHVRVGSPSVTIIPPPTIHTSEAIGPELNSLIDIFSPPRRDFSAKPGWVLNASDFPEA